MLEQNFNFIIFLLFTGYVGPLPAQAAVHRVAAVTAEAPVRVTGDVQTPGVSEAVRSAAAPHL